jgi:hypothetical protein
LPAVVETDGGDNFVVKFRGAGQGPKALVAELIATEIGQKLGLPIPRSAVITLADGFGRGEPDPEIQDVLRGSPGENFGIAYLSGAFGFDAAVDVDRIDPDLAADVVWFDAFITNPDRTARNPNMLRWQEQLLLIDHGASLYFHHRWPGWESRAGAAFTLIKDHVLLRRAGDLAAADARLRPRLTDGDLAAIAADVPEAWLSGENYFPDVEAHRAAYVAYLRARLAEPRAWVEHAIDAQRAR